MGNSSSRTRAKGTTETKGAKGAKGAKGKGKKTEKKKNLEKDPRNDDAVSDDVGGWSKDLPAVSDAEIAARGQNEIFSRRESAPAATTSHAAAKVDEDDMYGYGDVLHSESDVIHSDGEDAMSVAGGHLVSRRKPKSVSRVSSYRHSDTHSQRSDSRMSSSRASHSSRKKDVRIIQDADYKVHFDALPSSLQVFVMEFTRWSMDDRAAVDVTEDDEIVFNKPDFENSTDYNGDVYTHLRKCAPNEAMWRSFVVCIKYWRNNAVFHQYVIDSFI